ncbi:MAG: FAD-dependent oxidoreductase [Acidilobaceae archaeon]
MSLRLSLRREKPAVERREQLDVAIVGGGPAGVAAAIYSSRFLLKTAVLTKVFGGLLNETEWIDDYPGLLRIKSSELVQLFRKHLELFGVDVRTGFEVETIERSGGLFKIVSSRGEVVEAKAVILAIGLRRRRLNVPGEAEFAGRGVSYCSVCDAPLFRGRKSVAVVGGGDAAVEGALILSGYVEKVYLVHRRREFRAKPALVKEALARGNIEPVLSSVVTEILGDASVKAVRVKSLETGEEKILQVDGVFVEIGFEPPVDFLRRIGVELDSEGYVKVDEWMRTNIPGLFAAGDVISLWKGFKQVINAAATGAIASYSAYQYLLERGMLEHHEQKER